MEELFFNILSNVYLSLDYPQKQEMITDLKKWINAQKENTIIEEKISFLTYRLEEIYNEKKSSVIHNLSIKSEYDSYNDIKINYLKSRISELQSLQSLTNKNKTK